MSRSYRHIQECNKEIIELKHNGCPVRQICEKYRFSKNTTLYYFECSEFILKYIRALKETGVDGIIMAEPAAGLLSNDDATISIITYIGNNTG